MTVFTKNDSPESLSEFRKMCEKAYDKVSFWPAWEGYYEPSEAHALYVRSGQSWRDVEDGEDLLSLLDFQLAKEHYMSTGSSLFGDDADCFDVEQYRQYAGYSG